MCFSPNCATVLLILWSFTIMRMFAVPLCEEALYITGTADVELNLACNTSHLLSNVHIALEEPSPLYSFWLGINCSDANGSQNVSLDIWNSVHRTSGTIDLVHTPSLYLGLECFLYGCYKYYPSQHTFAVHPANCIIDEDECFMQTHNCSDWANCTDTIGNYECLCWSGYDGDGFVCRDINECDTGGHDCSEHAQCINTPGGYNCSCLSGYEGDGVNCTDEDECLKQTHNCSDLALCTNTIGNYKCSCSDGFDGDGYKCNDINECDTGGHGCNEHAQCINTPGGYNCSCLSVYDGDGINCTGIGATDECTQGTANCSLHASCIDIEDGYQCVCMDTYEGDGFTCTTAPNSMNVIVIFLGVPLSLVLLCLILSTAVMMICIFNSPKKQSWLNHLEGKWEDQDVDKDFTPVNLTVVVSSSLQSVIEPLYTEYKQTVICGSDITCKGNTEGESERSTSSSKMIPRDKHQTDHGINSTRSRADELLQSQNCTNEIPNNHECTVHMSQSQTSVFQLEDLNGLDSQLTKDESGFMSDTSSGVYLSFYNLSNRQ